MDGKVEWLSTIDEGVVGKTKRLDCKSLVFMWVGTSWLTFQKCCLGGIHHALEFRQTRLARIRRLIWVEAEEKRMVAKLSCLMWKEVDSWQHFDRKHIEIPAQNIRTHKPS